MSAILLQGDTQLLREGDAGALREDFAAAGAHGHGVLKVGGPGAVCGDGGPVVVQHLYAEGAEGDHGLDGQDHAALEAGQVVGGAVVGDLGVLMQVAAHAVAHVFPHDAEAEGLDEVLDGAADL